MISFQPTRTSQPYGRHDRPQTPQLSAMLLGRPLAGPNPIDQRRQMQRLMAMLLGQNQG
jgi:hypothetical protein